MRLADIRTEKLPHRRRKRVGRGPASGLGKTAGRGSKGAKSRSGSGGLIAHEGGQTPLHFRLPKRGFSNARFQKPHEAVNVGALNCFAADAQVGLEELARAGLIRRRGARIKILGEGALAVRLKVTAHAFSAGAAKKIQAAGGEIHTI